jgi:mannose/cellobiose epimerase-like protein (N-acyl-D-glucosamine 2-epimerase family)
LAYHLTGDPRYLAYAKSGVDYLRQNVFDRENGGTYAYWDGDARTWKPGPAYRNPQELAYSLLGVSFYYYLTHDPEVLSDILAVQKYIIENYYNPDLNALQWTLASDGESNPLDKRLVAQLDQLNAYMVLLTPLLPEPEQAAWKQDMIHLADIMLDEFYSSEDNLFFLSANTADEVSSANATTDFGHTIKAMWMIRAVGLLVGDSELVTFAETNGARVLSRAYLADSGSWALSVQQGGDINPDKDWWTYAELDQFASSLALNDPMQANYLPQTTDYYFSYFVDHDYGEVWSALNGATNQPYTDLPKAWPWKSAYHSFEHALVGYITAQQLYNQPVTLYYAFMQPPDLALVRPYFYTGNLQQLKKTTVLGTDVYQAQFTDIK